MKKIWSIALVIILCCALTACGEKNSADGGGQEGNVSSSGNATAHEDYFEWDVHDDTWILGYTEKGLKQTEIVIPAKCTVVQGLDGNETVKHISFESDDTEINSTTFAHCTSLETVKLPKNLTIIESYVFYDCPALKEITIPDSVTEINSSAFNDCESLTTVTLGQGVTAIKLSAFKNCTSLTSISIPDSVVTIGNSVFKGCSSLSEVNFGSGIEVIEDSAFEECDSLKSVKLQEGVTELGNYAFAFCDALEEIYIPASVESVGSSSITVTHTIDVYVVEGSYMDQRLEDPMAWVGFEFYAKKYQ